MATTVPKDGETATEGAEITAANSNGEAAEEPRPVLVWRQARFGGRRQGRDASKHAPGERKGSGKRKSRRKTPEENRRKRAKTDRPEREKTIDPDSPFAKLAALKEQLRK